MEKFEFKGDWEFDLELPAFSILSEGNLPFSISVEIEEVHNNDPDPLPHQLKALDVLVEQQEEIVQNIFNAVKNKYPELHELYGLGPDDEEYYKWFPPLNELSDLGKAINLGLLRVVLGQKDGLAYLEFSGNPVWDEEHGIEIFVLGTEVKAVDSIAHASVDYDERESDYDEEQESVSIEMIKAHPKYGKLKPWQKDFNRNRIKYLIQNEKRVSVLREQIRSGQIDPNGEHEGIPFVNIAAKALNVEGLRCLIESAAETRYAIIDAYTNDGRNRECFEYLLKKGADINASNQQGETLLLRRVNALADELVGRAHVHNDAHFERILMDVDRAKAVVVELAKLGARLPENFSLPDYHSDYQFEIDWLLQNPAEFNAVSPMHTSYEQALKHGQLEKGTHINGAKDGKIEVYGENGRLREESHYVQGIKHGEWRLYYKTGEPMTVSEFTYGKNTGTEMSYYESGALRAERRSGPDGKNKEIKEYYESGQLKKFVDFGNNSSERVDTHYYENGLVREKTVHQNSTDSWSRIYLETGQLLMEGLIVNYSRDGELKAYHDDGTYAGTITYVRGSGDAEAKYYHKNGKLSKKATWRNHKDHGWVEYYDENGQLRQKYLAREGLKNGPFNEYDENGTLRIKNEYLNDKLNGRHEEFYANGQLHMRGFFENGEQAGLWEAYDEQGGYKGNRDFGGEIPAQEFEEYEDANSTKTSLGKTNTILIVVLVVLILLTILGYFTQ